MDFKFHNLKTPIVCLSPMDGVTDFAYRETCKKYGNVDLLYTEFVNVHGLSLGVEKLINEFQYSEFQRPILSQIYGHEVEYFYPATLACLFLGFDGVDINMGCPAKKVSDRGAGAGLICDPSKAQQIILEVRSAKDDFKSVFLKKDAKEITSIDDVSSKLITKTIEELVGNHSPLILDSIKPVRLGKNIFEKLKKWNIDIKYAFSERRLNNLTVSVKTRIGYDSDITSSWIGNISKSNPDFIAIHGRTLKQMYSGSSNWESISKAVNTLKELNKDIPVFANGDIKTPTDAIKCLEVTKASGILIGRASYGTPWIFNDIKKAFEGKVKSEDRSMDDIKNMMLEHAKSFVNSKGEERFYEMRKNLAWAISGIPNASDVRSKLVICNSIEDLKSVLTTF